VSEEMAELNGRRAAEEGDESATVSPEHDLTAWLMVALVPRFLYNMKALTRLKDFEKPPLEKIRASKTAFAGYGFGDASGCRFGATVQIGTPILYHYGQWAM
jgi:hypothetical protein